MEDEYVKMDCMGFSQPTYSMTNLLEWLGSCSSLENHWILWRYHSVSWMRTQKTQEQKENRERSDQGWVNLEKMQKAKAGCILDSLVTFPSFSQLSMACRLHCLWDCLSSLWADKAPCSWTIISHVNFSPTLKSWVFVIVKSLRGYIFFYPHY